jgi:tripartite-type tricarboxylate transporter receptor subunit TctC
MIVPYPPAGATDAIARIIGQKLSEQLGRQFYVENHGGAGGVIGTALAAKGPADGYTILFMNNDFVITPILSPRGDYDPRKNFAPVIIVASAPQILVVHPSSPAKNMQEFIALVKAAPGKYNYATPGRATIAHLAGERFKLELGLDLVHVPFKGGGPAIASTIAGHTLISFAAVPGVAPHVRQGSLRALAVMSSKRSPAFPDVPTLAEAGVPNQESELAIGIVAPAGTPIDILNRLRREITRAAALPDVKDRLAGLGFAPIAGDQAEFSAWIASETAAWSKVIRMIDMKVQ